LHYLMRCLCLGRKPMQIIVLTLMEGSGMTMTNNIFKGYCECGCGLKTKVPKENDKSSNYIKNVPMKFISGHNSRKNKILGINHKNWKGDLVGYSALHRWVERKLGKPLQCEDCGTTAVKRYEWANISGEYKRDIKDFKRLCYKCHRKFDDHLIPRGEMVNTAKLTKEKVLEIRKLSLSSLFTPKILSKKFNVTSTMIHYIIKRINWKHI